MAYRLGVDVGGTFTDLLLVHDETGDLHRVKTPSTPADPSEGVLNGVRRICDEAGIDVADVRNILHGTTVATNAVLESKGARVGLITTQGFGQILHLARSQTPGPLAGWIIMIKPDPPASLADTREAVERMDAHGEAVQPVDVEQVEGIVRDLVESGVETLTVALINSYVNGAHEQQIGEIVERLYPGFPVTLSAEVLPEFREYERALTACMNSYVRPKVADYVNRLQQQLGGIGAKAEVNILRSDAGLMTAREAARNPIYGVLSGPSGGVAGALFVARKAGYDDILTLDMGGTSTDVALCQNGQPTIGRETSIGHFRIKVPSVNVHTVGAGGGSIAHVPELTKALRVGPQSAGAEPGPAAYGKGGDQPTVTDANVVLGRLPASLAGGLELDVDAARRAVQTFADALGTSLADAAAGIIDIVNENMATAFRVKTIERGLDPRSFLLCAFGGAGPLQAAELARLLGIREIVIPPNPGVTSAAGLLASDLRYDVVRSMLRRLDEVDTTALQAAFEEYDRELTALLALDGCAPEEIDVTWATDLRYRGQGYELTIPLDARALDGATLSRLRAAFDAEHRAEFGHDFPDYDADLVNLRVTAVGKVAGLDRVPVSGGALDDARTGEVAVSFRSDGALATCVSAVYDRELLPVGMLVSGPAIVTQVDSTTLVPPDATCERDQLGNLWIRLTRNPS